MEKKQEFIVNILYYGIILCFVYCGLKFLLPVLLPFVIAFVIVWVLKLIAEPLARKFSCARKPVLVGLLLAFYLLVGFALFRLSVSVVPAIGNSIRRLPEIYEEQILPSIQSMSGRVNRMFSRTGLNMDQQMMQFFQQALEKLGEMITEYSGSIVMKLTGYAVSIPSFTIKFITMIVASFFMAGDYDYLSRLVMKLLPASRRDQVRRVAQQSRNIIFIFLKSYMLLMALTFVELLIGFCILKVPYAVALSLAIAVFDILPILGTGGVLIPWTIIAAVLGDYKMAIGIGMLYLLITAVRNALEPRVVGKQIGLHPLATLVSMFVGAGMFGIVGLFGFPVVLSILIRMKSLEEEEIKNQGDR